MNAKELAQLIEGLENLLGDQSDYQNKPIEIQLCSIELAALADIHTYVRNLVYWLTPANRDDNLSSRIIRKTQLQTLDHAGVY